MPIPANQRILAFAMYLGAAPFIGMSKRWRGNAFLEHHFRQSAAIFLLLFLAAGIFLLAMLALSFALIQYREFFESSRLEVGTMRNLRRLFLCWAVFWLFGAGMAMLGAQRDMPIVARMAAKPRFVRGAWVMLIAVYALVLAFVPLALYANHLAEGPGGDGRVYMLYEDNGIFPRWLFTLGFFRAARASTERFGGGSAVVVRLSEATLEEALASAEFLFVGSHGDHAGLILPDNTHHARFTPADVDRVAVNPDLRFVYLTGCDSGTMREAWEQALSPARVVTYDRLTAVIEHIWWLWFEAPRVIRHMPAA